MYWQQRTDTNAAKAKQHQKLLKGLGWTFFKQDCNNCSVVTVLDTVGDRWQKQDLLTEHRLSQKQHEMEELGWRWVTEGLAEAEETAGRLKQCK